tara:strand:- start:1862 stop:2401 length:540 start_codon:yes stop_codon:yes gene_type:complete
VVSLGQEELNHQVGLPKESYFATRYSVLREPLGMPLGSERLGDDEEAVHAWIESEGQVLCVGRAHIIPLSSDGSGADHKGPNAPTIPAFGPLANSSATRPAFQIRQMGTLPKHQRNGYAAQVLSELERIMTTDFGSKTGFLQARIHAVPFYQSQGWSIIDKPYEIVGIGQHYSMSKKFS